MASGIFAVLDDIAALMDDVAMMSKVAAKKTAGILGDDLAVNAEKASGFTSSRELPVLWAITKGSFLNKLIILPIAFLLSAYLPIAVTLILIIGGLYLAYEGAEKLLEFMLPHSRAKESLVAQDITESEILAIEKQRIKSAITTDFILSVEIIIIALGTVVNESIAIQIIVVTLIALLATVGVYGLVMFIVRMDEVGYKLIKRSEGEKGFLMSLGSLMVRALPVVIKSLSVIGTIALFLVAGGIFVHNIDFVHHFLYQILPDFPTILLEFIVGLLVGIATLLLVVGGKGIWKASSH